MTPVALLSFAFNLIGGGAIVRTTIVIKCIADVSPPERLSVSQHTHTLPPIPAYAACVCTYADSCVARTNSYNYISGFYFLASVGGSSIGSLLLSQHVYILNGLSIACYALTACVSATVSGHCGRDEQDDESSVPVLSEDEDDTYESFRPSSAENARLSRNVKPKVIRSRSSFCAPILTAKTMH